MRCPWCPFRTDYRGTMEDHITIHGKTWPEYMRCRAIQRRWDALEETTP